MYHFVKRLFDLGLAIFLLAITLPITLVTCLALFVSYGESPFFFQERPGLHEKLFKIVKFKTMNSKKDSHGNLLPDKDRLTPLGKAVRKFSIDELPQLINIIKGEMSFIGPRPLLTSYLPYYTGEEKLRHTVKPGITGLAQVSGRNYLTWDKRIAKDIEYVKNQSLSLDLQILRKTIRKVLKQEDVVVDPYSHMVDFITYKNNLQKEFKVQESAS
ncbi:MAG: sugar transferase [Allomuricauda sp.]